jgi:hypothetical protein
MSNFIKSQAKRKRELAKLDKRQAKEQKRAQKKAADRSDADNSTPTLAVAPIGQSAAASRAPVVSAAPAPRPMTLAEAAERWKSMKVAKPAKR